MRALTESDGTLLLPRKDQSNGAGPKWSNSAGHSTLEATFVGLVGGVSLKQKKATSFEVASVIFGAGQKKSAFSSF